MKEIKIGEHQPVLLKEVIQFLDPKPNENFIDCTLGQAGHSNEILKRTGPKGKLLAIDLDQQSINKAKEKLAPFGQRVIFVKDNFVNLKNIIDKQNFQFAVNGILFDLGLSLAQIADKEKGISFQINGPLDMRIGQTNLTAQQIINQWPLEDLKGIFRKFGQEKYTAEIAEKILEARKKYPIESTLQLANLIKEIYQIKCYFQSKVHPATRVFQALRIRVNNELENLEKTLPQALEVLVKNGRLTVISFQSLEDKIVKNFFKKHVVNLKILTKKPITPSWEEIRDNPRARSAKLRAIIKL